MARDGHLPGWGDWGLGLTAFHSENSNRDYLKGGDYYHTKKTRRGNK